MSSESAEVAEDYRLALEDLNTNMRFEISNLTVIARENTEHALAIAEVLEKHILKTAPSKKLPALYVLDSIVKNVGTPYTLYLGRNLFKTFMEAYTVVDNATRKRMEEMLKTWKQPVAGSMDTRPVFSVELVRPIENALMKAKGASVSQGPLPGRPRPVIAPQRDTPTPPGGLSGQGHPFANGGPAGQMPVHAQQQQFYPSHPASQPAAPNPGLLQPPSAAGYGLPGTPALSAGVNIETLSNDIQNLITAMRSEFSQNPHDSGIQTRLKALLDLQRIVQTTSLPPDQLELIKKQVTDLAAVTLQTLPVGGHSSHSTPTPVPYQSTPTPVSVAPVAAPPAPAAASTRAPITIDSLLGQGALAALMARTGSQQSTPNPPPSTAPVRSPQPALSELHRPAPSQAQNPSSLLDQLRHAGLLPAATPSNAGAFAPPPALPAGLPASIASLLSPSASAPPGFPRFNMPAPGGLSSSSLKQAVRPDIIAQLYDNLGPPCTQCGRRFKTDDLGRRKKMAHMDWHFRVHQRSTEADKRGTHRSWYVDEQDWLKSREVVDSDQVVSQEESTAEAAKTAAEAAKPKYIPVPDPNSGINNVCPICQDKFENKWLDTAQEWVWLDAVLVGNRAYHASCHAEATRDREGTPRRTPEPILGKRKAEVGLSSPKVRSLKTSA